MINASEAYSGTTAMPYMDVIADFHRDHLEIIRKDLKYWESDLTGLSDDDIAYGYYELMHRMISAEPRKILFSQEFFCPADYQAGLDWLLWKIKTGEETFPHLSRRIIKFKAHDKHLSDWGIQHLHLGTSYQSNGLVVGRKFVLYGIFTKTHAYLIDIREHDWFQVDLLNIVLRNWPHLLTNFEMRGCFPDSTLQMPGDYKVLRDKNVNAGVVLEDGKLYAGPGGGMMCSGHSMNAVRRRDYEHEQLRAFLQSVRQDPEPYFSVFYSGFKYRPRKLKLKLIALGNFFFCSAIGSDTLLAVWPVFPAQKESPEINMTRRIRANTNISSSALAGAIKNPY